MSNARPAYTRPGTVDHTERLMHIALLLMPPLRIHCAETPQPKQHIYTYLLQNCLYAWALHYSPLMLPCENRAQCSTLLCGRFINRPFVLP